MTGNPTAFESFTAWYKEGYPGCLHVSKHHQLRLFAAVAADQLSARSSRLLKLQIIMQHMCNVVEAHGNINRIGIKSKCEHVCLSLVAIMCCIDDVNTSVGIQVIQILMQINLQPYLV